MKFSRWEFSIEHQRIVIRTPWCGIVWYEYSKHWLYDALVRGFSFYGGKQKLLREGDSFYKYEYNLFTDIYSMRERLKDM